MILAGFDSDVVSEFETQSFRSQIQLFVLKLYEESDKGSLSDDFTNFLEKMLNKQRPGPVEKVMEFAKVLF